jgi:hypothetical protein
MWRLGCRPIRIWPFGRRVTVRATRNRDARQLAPDDSRAICAVIWEVGRQSAFPHLPHNAQAAEHLHRARRDVVALHIGRFAGTANLRHDDINAAGREIHGRGQSDWPRSDDENLGFNFFSCQFLLLAGQVRSGTESALDRVSSTAVRPWRMLKSARATITSAEQS